MTLATEEARESRQEAEQRFRTIFDNISDGIFLHHLKTQRIVMCNESCLQMLGYTQEEFLKLSISDLHPPADLPFVQAQIEVLLQGGQPIRHDIRFQRKDGSIFFADVRPDLVWLDGKRYVAVALKDITERKRLEGELRRHTEHLEELVVAQTGELRESEARYRSLYHTIADGIFVMGADGRLVDVNDSACTQLGYTRKELIGMPMAAICGRPNFEVAEALDRLRAAGNRAYETTHRRKDGVLIPVELSIAPITYRGQPAVLGVARDITERKRAEDALRESEARHRRLIDNLKGSHFIYRHDTQGVFQYVSESITGILGYARDEFTVHYSRYLTDHPANQAAHRSTELTLQGIRPPPYEVNTWHKDGSSRWLEVQEVPVFDGQGKVIAVEGVAQDITERKEAEEALRQKEYLLSESQRIGHIGTWSVDLATNTVTWTPETYRLFGVSLETFVPSADTLITLLHPEDRDAMREWIRAALAGEHPEAVEVRIVRPDGSIRIISGRGEFIPPNGHEHARLVGTAQDVTEQKQAQAAILESEERYRILLENGFDGIFVHEGFRIVQLNDRLAEMTGYTREELLGSNAIDLFTPAAQEHIRRYIRSGAGGCYEIELQRHDGHIVPVESYGAPCRFQGRSARIVGIRDITERKRAQETQRRQNELLEEQVAQRTEDLRHTVRRLRELTLELSQAEDRERQRIAGLLHEDLQQTLAAARFHLNLLSGEPRSPADTRETVEQVQRMLREAIEKARRLSHELSPVLYQVDLAEILNWLARHMQREHGLRVQVQAPGQVDSSSEPLKALLYKVAQELLFNIVKHAAVSEARIRVRRCGRYLCLSVADHGRGFDPEGLQGAAGFGLLAIRERIQLVGGRMKIKSAPGAGTRILIVVPDEGCTPVAAPSSLMVDG